MGYFVDAKSSLKRSTYLGSGLHYHVSGHRRDTGIRLHECCNSLSSERRRWLRQPIAVPRRTNPEPPGSQRPPGPRAGNARRGARRSSAHLRVSKCKHRASWARKPGLKVFWEGTVHRTGMVAIQGRHPRYHPRTSSKDTIRSQMITAYPQSARPREAGDRGSHALSAQYSRGKGSS